MEAHLARIDGRRSTGDVDALAAELAPDLAHAVNTEGLLPDRSDLAAKGGVAAHARRRAPQDPRDGRSPRDTSPRQIALQSPAGQWGGGLSSGDTLWVPCRPGFFLPVRVLSRLFRRLFLEGLSALHGTGKLAFFGDLEGLADAEAFAAWLAPLRKSEWVVCAKPPFGGPEAVLAYLSRYTHPLPGSGLHGKP